MSWSSSKQSSSLQEEVSDTESSSEEDVPFVYKVHSSAQYQNMSCQHSKCANRFSKNVNYKGNCEHNEGELNDIAACSNSCIQSDFCDHLNFCSNVLPNDNCTSSNIRVCMTGTADYTTSDIVLSVPSNLNHSHSINVLPTNSQSVNESNGHFSGFQSNSVSDELNLTSGQHSYAADTPSNSCSFANSYVKPIPCEKFNEDKCKSHPNRYGYLAQDHELTLRGKGIQNCSRLSTSVHDDKNLHLDSHAARSNSPHNSSGALYNWQATMTTVKERFAFLFNNEVLSDVHFRVGKGEISQRIPAHKFVLAVGSAVFDAMFNGKLSTRQEEIELPDVEPQAFLSLLRFLYSDDVQIGPETVMTVLYTAKKYAVPALEKHCVDFLKSNLSSDNAFMLLTQARLFDEPQLAALCLDTIDKSTSDALTADGFTDIDHNTLCLVLERDTLRIRESKLFQAVVRWSEAQCSRRDLSAEGTNQRTVLENALSLIRFPLMTIEEFAEGPAQSNILTDREIVQLFLYFTVNPKPPINFLDTPRCCMTGKEQKVCRFPQIESRWGYSGTSDRIRFIVDKRIFVVGFGMYGSTHGPAEYEVTIQIIHTATQKVCASNDTSFISDGSIHTFRVMFKEPVEVLPNTNYTAYAILKGPDSRYGTKGVRKITVECPSGDRVTFQFTYAAGNNNGTSVEDGQIPEIIFYT